MPLTGAGPADPSTTQPSSEEPCTADRIESAVTAIEVEFAAFLPRATRVTDACDLLRGCAAELLGPAGRDHVARLLPLVARRVGAVADALFDILVWTAPSQNATAVYGALWSAQDPKLRRRAVDELADAVDAGRLAFSPALLQTLADRLEREGSGLTNAATLDRVDWLLDRLTPDDAPIQAGAPEPIRHRLLFDRRHPAVRRLAARLLDRDSIPPGEPVIKALLGPRAAGVLMPYLVFTRALHRDVLDLVSMPESAVDTFRHAERLCGRRRLGDILAALGWSRVNAGIQARRRFGVSLAGSFPLVFDPLEIRLLDGCPAVRRVFDRFLVVAFGRRESGIPPSSAVRERVARFRAYSIGHAEVLAHILDVAPLTRARLETVLERVGRLVADFEALFGASGDKAGADESLALRRVYQDLRIRIEQALAETDVDPLPLSVCRLVQPFEDPATVGEIRTLHGLKRYLHQRGLKLAFTLIGTGPDTSQTIDIAIAGSDSRVDVIRRIEFADLEGAGPDGASPAVPHAVSLIVEAYASQALHGRRVFPYVQVFCYGNEVHYFVTFRNHPAFIRVDFSPPLRGGMIDLQYLGVSNNDLSHHPCPSLDSIRRVFEHLDFIVSVETTRIHARYDKERAVTLDDLHQRAQHVLHLVPYLMDIDWTIGSLELSAESRACVATAWAGFFARWGVLPSEQFLTTNRTGILVAQEAAPEGPREIRWDGCPPYRDRYSVEIPPAVTDHLQEMAVSLGLQVAVRLGPADVLGQFRVDECLLQPLRAALVRGEVEATSTGLRRRPSDVYECVHDVERLAAILDAPAPVVVEAARLGPLVPLLERHVRFDTVGSLNGYPVQRARVGLGATTLIVCCLRDALGMPRLAVVAEGPFFRSRRRPAGAWRESAVWDADRVQRVLRRANLLGVVLDAPAGPVADRADELRQLFRRSQPDRLPRTGGSERVATGVAASPGRAAGPARLGSAGWLPDDVDGAILMTPALEPHDAPLLWRAAGVVSTGGGILSHLGLLAVESGKPALIIAAAWSQLDNGERVLVFQKSEHDCREREWHGYRLVEYHRVREVDDIIRDGDLVAIEASHGTLTVLGQEPVTLAFHEALRQHAEACDRLERDGPDSLLVNRGHLLRARHQLERISARVTDPGLARFGVRHVLLGQGDGAAGGSAETALSLLRLLAAHPTVGDAAREAVREVTATLAVRIRDARQQAVSLIPSCTTPHDVLALRLNVVRPHRTLASVIGALDRAGLESGVVGSSEQADLDVLALRRLRQLREGLVASLVGPAARPGGWLDRRERVRQLDDLLGASLRTVDVVMDEPAHHPSRRAEALARCAAARVVTPDDGGAELEPLLGAKGANLAEAARILGRDAIPGWFALTSVAFGEALNSRVEASVGRAAAPSSRCCLRGAIETVLTDAAASPASRSASIRDLWTRVRLPDPLADDILRGYRHLGDRVLVAIRSSALGEDTARTSRAGQMETFLFVRGEDEVLAHVKLAWAGFWSERALRDRLVRGESLWPSGGLVIQRMVHARVSGVVQTVNAAESHPCELVINVGLGLGEGIVSGVVSADHVVVAKDASTVGLSLRFRYLTADKRTRVVFDERFGCGTVRVDTLAHQRLRPALEYPELCALVEMAHELELACAHPLDIEFAWEEADLRLLQVRPVPGATAVWPMTAEGGPYAIARLLKEEVR